MLKYTLIAFLWISLISGCSTIPKEPNGTGMLLVAVHSQKPAGTEYFVNYRVYDSVDGVFYVKPEAKYVLIKNLTPGSHKIEFLESMYKKSGKLMTDRKTYLPFTIKENTITVLDHWLEVSVYKKEGRSYQKSKFKPIPKIERDILIESFSEKNELGIWGIDS